jgi:drug/metabolite transporter (DMT)-like permease
MAADRSAVGTALAVRGCLYGVLAALIWGSQLVMWRAGVSVGLDGFDVAAIRCGAAGLVMLPWFMIQHPYGRGAGRTAWSHAVWLALAAGPLFTFASLGGFRFAPLPYGAVLQPSAMVLRSMLLSILFLGKRWRPLRLLGAAVIVLGLILIGGPALLQGDRLTPFGDLSFMTAGVLFATYSILQKRWSVDPGLRRRHTVSMNKNRCSTHIKRLFAVCSCASIQPCRTLPASRSRNYVRLKRRLWRSQLMTAASCHSSRMAYSR